jgi:hypothetical protein
MRRFLTSALLAGAQHTKRYRPQEVCLNVARAQSLIEEPGGLGSAHTADDGGGKRFKNRQGNRPLLWKACNFGPQADCRPRMTRNTGRRLLKPLLDLGVRQNRRSSKTVGEIDLYSSQAIVSPFGVGRRRMRSARSRGIERSSFGCRVAIDRDQPVYMLKIAPEPIRQILGDDVKPGQHIGLRTDTSPMIPRFIQVLVLGVFGIQSQPPCFHLLRREWKIDEGGCTLRVTPRAPVLHEPGFQSFDVV